MSPYNILNLIKKLLNSKSLGYDLIINALLKNIPQKAFL